MPEAIMEPPAASAEPAFDPLTFEIPSPADVAGEMHGEAPEARAEPPAPKPPEQPKPEVAKPAEPAKPEKPEPASHLRKKLGEVETERNTLIQERDNLRKELDAARTDTRREQLEKELAQNRKELVESQRKLAARDPRLAPKVQELSEAYKKQWNEFVETTGIDSARMSNVEDQFAKLPRGTPEEYRDALRDFRQGLSDEFGAMDGNAVFEQIRRNATFRNQYNVAYQEAEKNGGQMQHEEQLGKYNSGKKFVEENFDKWFEPPANYELTDPFNLNGFLKQFESGMKPEDVAGANRRIQTYVTEAFNGMQPRTRADFPAAWSDEQVAAEQAKLSEAHATHVQDSQRVMAVAMKGMMYTKAIMADYSRLLAKEKKSAQAAPPDPTGGGEPPARNAGDTLASVEIPTPEQTARGMFN